MMNEEENPNKELARMYYKNARWILSSKTAKTVHEKVKIKITNCPVDIAAHYKTYGNLKTLRVEGIGPHTTRLLEGILQGHDYLEQ